MEILAEQPGPLGRYLWLLHRDVELWAASSPQMRSGLFHPGSLHAPPEETLIGIVTDIRILHRMLAGETISGGAVACRTVAAWAADAAPKTALYFAWAAAAVAPESAAMAREVATHAWATSESRLAESWLRRAIALARSEDGWATYARAFTDLGTILAARVEHGRARKAFIRALRTSRRHGLPRTIRAGALLGLLRLALTDPELGDAGQLQRRLLRLHAMRHPQALRIRVAIAQALVDHGQADSAVALLDNPSLLRGASPDIRESVGELLELARERAGEFE